MRGMNAHIPANSIATPQRPWLSLVGWVFAAHLAGALGGLATTGAPSFYGELARPAWAPPAGLFGPVWLALYTLMGIAAWLVWKERERLGAQSLVRTAITLFVIQLFVNALWSWLFFAWHQGALSFAWILVLIALVIATMRSFWRVRGLAGALLLPYLGWIVFAAALNYTLWRSNPAILG